MTESDQKNSTGGHRVYSRDKILTCAECGTQFTFTAADQEFYAARGYQEPRRCPTCRQARRSARSTEPERQMYPAVCSSCGAETNVPFLPRQDRPVYCDACYAKVRPSRPTGT